MIYRRICYALLLGAAVLFQIFFRFYFSTFLLVLVAVLPLVSVLLALPAALGGRLTPAPGLPAWPRGEGAIFRLTAESRTGLPLLGVRVRLGWHNQLTGQAGTAQACIRCVSRRAEAELSLPAPHCGRLVCRVERAWACDQLGLFPIPLHRGGEAAMLLLPRAPEEALEELPLPEAGAGQALRPRPGGGPGEDYDLREYRPGDPPRSIHWKLSSKLDALLVRETLEADPATLILTYDHFGTPEELDGIFDRLYALSQRLLEKGRPHEIQWALPLGGGVECCAVDSGRALTAFLERAFSLPAPAQGISILDGGLRRSSGGRARHIHLSADGEGGGL